jgi:catechol 2,3-dioxygenase-like lactoylglutathione lyase family enzyme/GNAT superfamily N-acetyltransferase
LYSFIAAIIAENRNLSYLRHHARYFHTFIYTLTNLSPAMIFKHVVPILNSSDITRSIAYYTEVLGFESKWEWDSPPTFGGVSKNSIEIFFCLNGQGSPGTWLSVFVDDVDAFYESAKAKGAKILCEPETMEWGIREMVVEDPDGHRIRFGSGAQSDRQRNATGLPATVKITARMPTSQEMRELCVALGYASANDAVREISPHGIEYVVVAEDTSTSKLVGTAFILGDRAGFYYIKNVFVHPGYQGKRVGSSLMQALTDWMDENALPGSAAYLNTAENLAPFYRQFGFGPVYGMYRKIK